MTACAVDRAAAPEEAYTITIASGDRQLGPSMMPLASPLVVRIADANGSRVRGVRVRFSVDRTTSATAAIVDSIVVSDADGRASAWLRLGQDSLAQEWSTSDVAVTASIASAPGRSVRFTATRQGTTQLQSISPSSVQAGDRLTFAGTYISGYNVRAHFGDVIVTLPSTAAYPLPGLGGSGVVTVPPCVAPGKIDFWLESDGRRSNSLPLTIVPSRAPLDLAPYQFVTLPASRVSECVSVPGNGATYLVVGQFAAAGTADSLRFQLGSNSNFSDLAQLLEPTSAKPRADLGAQHAFDGQLRDMERSVIPAVRAQPRSTAAKVVQPPELGSVRRFEVTAKTDGSAFTMVDARLRYAGEKVLVYTDTTYSGFSNAQLMALAALFDKQLVDEAVRVFGAEPDVDGNGRIIVLFTPAVNRLAKREDCFFRGYVTAYFYPVDQLERAAHSNRGEILYAFVPDPDDKYSCTHTEEDVVRLVQPAFLHEMQHLISFNQRVLARNAGFEDIWLNEGLSQMAEELGSRIFERRYPAPLGRGTTTQLFPDSSAPFIAPQMLNSYVYLYFSLQHSVTSFNGAGSLEDRGASWLFLRWLADQKGEGILGRLVQSPTKGIANIESVAGETFGELFGDFGLALFADSLPGLPRTLVPPRLRFTTRNIRQLMAREQVIAGFDQPYPVATYRLDRDGSLRSSMPRGTMIHAILQSKPGDGPVRLSFRTFVGAPFEASAGAQVSIMRLPQ